MAMLLAAPPMFPMAAATVFPILVAAPMVVAAAAVFSVSIHLAAACFVFTFSVT